MALKFLNKILKKDEPRRGEKKSAAEVKEAAPPVLVEKKVTGDFVPGVLIASHVTEKTSRAVSEGKYAFIVSGRAYKSEIKRAVSARYGVGVREVNIVNIPGKERRRGRQIGWRPGYKKAIVTLEEGQNIDIQ